MKQFIIKLAGVSVAIVLIAGVLFSWFLPQYYLPVLPILLLFFIIVTIFIHAWQLQLAKKDIGKFARSNMLITFFKLVLYSIIAVAYIAYDSANAIVFVVCLMLLYLIFSFVEVSSSIQISKSKKE